MSFSETLRPVTRFIGRIPVILQPLLFLALPVIVLHPLWSAGASDAGASERPLPLAVAGGTRPSIRPDTIHQFVEGDSRFTEVRKATIPKRLPYPYETVRQHPEVEALERLQLVEVLDRDTFNTRVELTAAGRSELLEELTEEDAQYVLAIARRKYVVGSESIRSYGQGPAAADEAEVQFLWTWEPLNRAGGQFPLLSTHAPDGAWRGWATFRKSGGLWTMNSLQLETEQPDPAHARF